MKHKISTIDFNYNIAEYTHNLLQSKILNNTDILESTIIVPTRRFGYILKEFFAKNSTNNTSFTPQILTIDDLQQTPLVKDLSFYKKLNSLKPKYSHLNAKIALYKLIKAKNPKVSTNALMHISDTLEQLINDAAINDVDFTKLEDVNIFESSEYFRQNLKFLQIVYKTLPEYLNINDIKQISRLHFQEQVLTLQTKMLTKHKPKNNIIAVGLRSLSKATCLLLQEISTLEKGEVIFYGFDNNATGTIKESNPQFVYTQMLNIMNIKTQNVLNKTPKTNNTNHKKLAYNCFNKQENISIENTSKINVLNCKTKEEESLKIALILKEAFIKNKSSCLATYNNEIANRVETKLKAWGINPNNSIGKPLTTSKNVNFITSVFNIFYGKFNIVSFSAFIKHPLSYFGLTRARALKATRAIDKNIFRDNNIIINSINDIEYYLNNSALTQNITTQTLDDCKTIINKITSFLKEIKLAGNNSTKQLALLIKIAKECSFNEKNKALVFSEQEGENIKNILQSFTKKAEDFNNLHISDIFAFITKEFSKVVIRQQYLLNKNITITSPLEAYMLNFNTIVCANLNDGAWPQKTKELPWLGKATSAKLGLATSEQKIGSDALFFVKNLCANNVFITRASKTNDSNNYPSRFLIKLEHEANRHNIDLTTKNNVFNNYYNYITGENSKVSKYKAIFPNVAHGLKNNISVTELQTWYNNPFEFFVGHVLNIKPLKKLHEDNKSLIFGNVIHYSLEQVIKELKALDENNLLKEEQIEEKITKNMKKYEKNLLFMLQNKNNVTNIIKNSTKAINKLATKTPINLYSEIKGGLLFEEYSTYVKARVDFTTTSNENTINIIDFKTGSKNSGIKRIQLSLIQNIMQQNGFKDFNNSTLTNDTKYKLEYWFLKQGEHSIEKEINIKEVIKDFAKQEELKPAKYNTRDKINAISRINEEF